MKQADWVGVASGAADARGKVREAYARLTKILAEELTINASRSWVSMPELLQIRELLGSAAADLTQGLKGNSPTTKRGKMSK